MMSMKNKFILKILTFTTSLLILLNAITDYLDLSLFNNSLVLELLTFPFVIIYIITFIIVFF